MSAPIAKGPIIQGWCPGAYRPMVSGDGLVVRIRPWLGQITATQATALCDVVMRFGTGTLELTSRANLQIRGVAAPDHAAVIATLQTANLLDTDPAAEGRRNLLMTPDWTHGDDTHRLAIALMRTLSSLPVLPAKFGYAVDTGSEPWLIGAPADVRFEWGAEGALILVADGTDAGRAVTFASALDALQEMVAWFVETGGREAGRMARHLRNRALPAEWTRATRRVRTQNNSTNGTLLGVPFGQLDVGVFKDVVARNAIQELRILPGRRLLAMGVSIAIPVGFCAPGDPLHDVHACTGAPGCPQAFGPTRTIARALAASLPRGEVLHVSGCTKGCAHPRNADHTLIATKDGFDLVSQGAPWDAPTKRGLPSDLTFKDIQT